MSQAATAPTSTVGAVAEILNYQKDENMTDIEAVTIDGVVCEGLARDIGGETHFLCESTIIHGRCCDVGAYSRGGVVPILCYRLGYYHSDVVTPAVVRSKLYAEMGTYGAEIAPGNMAEHVEGVAWCMADDDPCEPRSEWRQLVWKRLHDLDDDVAEQLSKIFVAAVNS